MTEKEKVEEIMEKYNRNFSTLQKNASAKELKTVFKFVADESNRKQRELIGLDKKNKYEMRIVVEAKSKNVLGFFYAMKVDMEGKEITISNSTDRH